MREIVLGIDMGGTKIKLGLMDSSGSLIKTKIIEAHSNMLFTDCLDKLSHHIKGLLEDDFLLGGIGISFPGIVDHINKKIISRYVKYRDAHKVDLRRWLEKNDWNDVPLVLENDARSALIGEWQYGAGKGWNNTLMVTLGTGMGSAVLINGELFRGANFLGGSLGGHMTIDVNGETCNCGNIGCVETLGSTWSLSKNLKKIDSYQASALSSISGFGYEEVFRLASHGDSVAQSLKQKSIEAWSFGIINLLHAFDPELLIIGGGVMKSKDEVIPLIRDKIDEYSWLPKGSLVIKTALQREHAGVLGVGHLLQT